MPKKFSKAAAEAEEILTSLGKGKAVPQHIVSRIMEIINTVDNKKNPVTKALIKNPTIRQLIKLQIMQETDWRKKAVLAAMLVSDSLGD